MGIGADLVQGIYYNLVAGHSRPEDVSFRRESKTCSAEHILTIVCDVLSVSRAGVTRRQRHSWLRRLTAQMLCDYGGLTQRQVPSMLQPKTGAAVSQQLKRLSEELGRDASLQKKRAAMLQGSKGTC